MHFSTITDLAWADAEHSKLDCSVVFEALGSVPFTAAADDPEPHGRDIFLRASAGEFGPIAPYVAPVEPPVDLARYAANRRWQTETGGTAFAGMAIATDDRSKLMIMGARLRAEADPAVIEHWLAADGQIHDLDATGIIALSDAVAAHVSACFSRYAAVRAAIEAGSVTTTDAVDQAFADVTAAWPA